MTNSPHTSGGPVSEPSKEGGDVAPATGVVSGAGAVGSSAIQIKSSLFGWWADVAEEHAAAAKRARLHADPVIALSRETHAGLVAVCASAFAVEDLILELGQVVLEQEVRTKWYGTVEEPERRPPPVERRILETLKLAVLLSPAQVQALVTTFRHVLSARHRAVHFYGDFADAVPHPSGTTASAEEVLYSADAAETAVAVMRAIFGAVADHPKPQTEGFSNKNATVLKRDGRRPDACPVGEAGP